MPVATFGAGIGKPRCEEVATEFQLGQLRQHDAAPFGKPQAGTVEAVNKCAVSLLISTVPRSVSPTRQVSTPYTDITPASNCRRIKPPHSRLALGARKRNFRENVRHIRIPDGHPAIELLARCNIFGERRCTDRLRVRGVSGSPELELLRIVGRRGPPLDTPDVQKIQPQQQRLRVITIRCIGHVPHACGGQKRVDSQIRKAGRVEDKPLTWKCAQP